MNHTNTLWHLSHHVGDGFSIAHEIAPGCGRLVHIATVHDSGGWHGEGNALNREQALANANRIIACVNACAGMENPEQEIKKLRGR